MRLFMFHCVALISSRSTLAAAWGPLGRGSRSSLGSHTTISCYTTSGFHNQLSNSAFPDIFPQALEIYRQIFN
jgi:hypothetical protein